MPSLNDVDAVGSNPNGFGLECAGDEEKQTLVSWLVWSRLPLRLLVASQPPGAQRTECDPRSSSWRLRPRPRGAMEQVREAGDLMRRLEHPGSLT